MDPSPMEQYAARSRPSAIHFIWSPLILVCGIGAFIWLIWNGITSMDTGFIRFALPGEHTVSLKQDTYTVFYESRSVLNNRTYSTPEQLPPIQITVTQKSDGHAVSVSAGSMNATYEFGSRKGQSFMEFTAPSAGEYVVAGGYPTVDGGPEIVLALSNSFGTGLVSTILGGLAVCFGSLVLAVVVLVLVIRSRRLPQPHGHPVT